MLLTQRTNILFTEPDYRTLKELSQKNNQTMGEYVRRVVISSFKKHKAKTTAQLFKEIRNLAKGINTKGMNYKELRDYGRKY